jgi:hypothetical protein
MFVASDQRHLPRTHAGRDRALVGVGREQSDLEIAQPVPQFVETFIAEKFTISSRKNDRRLFPSTRE